MAARLEKLAAHLTSTTTLLESLHQIYTSVVFFLERADKFTRLLSTIVDAFADIANRHLKPAADRVETTLASLLRLALDWFLRLLGLGDMPQVVAEKVTLAREWVDELLDKYLDKFIEWAVKAFNKGKQAATNAVGAVKGWLGLSQEFKVDKEIHHVFVADEHGRPTLMVASTPLAYDVFLGKLKIPETPATKVLVEKAIALSHKLQALLPTTVAPNSPPPMPDAADAMLHELAQLTMELMSLSREAAAPFVSPRSTPVFSGVTAAGFGVGMHMEYYALGLTTEGCLITTGSVPDSPRNETYEKLNYRGTFGSSFYIKGHLLNHNLHGTGTEWENLTPLSRSGNSQHHGFVGFFLKEAARQSVRPANHLNYRAFFYSVVPRYGRSVQQHLLDEVRQAKHPEALKNQVEDKVLIDLIEAEQHVPLNLVCPVQEVDAFHGQAVAGGVHPEADTFDASHALVIQKTVDNPVPQGSWGDYLLNPGKTGSKNVRPEKFHINPWDSQGVLITNLADYI